MFQKQYNNLTIKILDEPTYKFGSTDNNFNYASHHFNEGAQEYPVSKHGVKILDGDKAINSCILIGAGGASGVHQNSFLIDNDRLLVCCCDTIFCLTLPDLHLVWQTQADPATCFQIFKYENDFIVHGELEVTKLNQNGEIKWKFSGADIFVTTNGSRDFTIENDGISLTDFTGKKYKIDFDGKLLWER